jgi:NAD(P)-dependent dehydrogenase (short-subunit alcohol dehydrogenase family)
MRTNEDKKMARILITGASRGLGRALAVELTRRGHKVVASARQIADLADLPVAEKIALDVTVPSSVRDAIAAVRDVDVVINNAAINAEGPVEAVPVETVQNVFETNVFGPLRVIHGFLPGMRAGRRGVIVNISSLAGQFAPPLQGVYSASKAALEMLSEALQFEVQHFGVQVMIIQSGGIRTDKTNRPDQFSIEAYDPLIQQQNARLAQYAKRGGGAMPEEIARAIAEIIENPKNSLRVPVGGTGDRFLARFGKGVAGRLVRLGLNW